MRVFPKLDARPRRSARALRPALSSLLTLVLALAGVWGTAMPASAAPALSITPITWNIVGLDHNAPVTAGPDTFASGARVCNTGDAPAANVVSSYVWDSANSYIDTTGLTTLSVASLAAGACTDFYYNVVVARTAAAFGTARRFHITAAADGLGTVSTPTPREIYVEQLQSQNRNQITSITGPSNVVVGNTYTYVLTSDTSSSFEQWSSFLNFPNFAFQIVSVSATYTQPGGATNSTIYADGCGFQQNPTLANYRECVGPPNFPDGAVGGTAITTYQVKILSSGAFGINALIYDKSGGSYHYNSDWGAGGKSVTAVEEADVSITKSGSVDPVIAGEDLTYTLNVTNAGPSTARDVTISDPLPAGTSFVSASDGGTNIAGTVSWAIGDLSAGASVSRTLTVTVDASRQAALSNTASVTTTTTDTDPVNNAVTEGTTVHTSAGVSLTKTDSVDPVVAGQDVTYTMTAVNEGPSTARDVQITDAIPAGTSFVSASDGGALAGGVVTWDLGSLAAGQSVDRTLTVHVAEGRLAPLSNTASVTTATTDVDPLDDSDSEATTVAISADLSVSVDDVVDPVDLGEDITYEILVSNGGPSDAANVDVEAALPAELTFVAADPECSFAGGVVTCSLPTLAAGAAHTFTVVASPLAATTVTLPVEVSSDATDPDASDDADAEQSVVDAPLVTDADLAVSIADLADPVPVGGTLAYTISVTNTGPANAFGVEVEQILPTGAAFVSATPSQGSCVEVAGTVTCALGAIASAGTVTIDVVADAPGVAGTANSGVTVDALSPDPDPSNDADDEDTEVRALSADLSLVKTDLAPSVVAGGWTIYTLTLTNPGPDEAPAGVVITDVAPAGTSLSESEADCSIAGVTLTCTTQAAIPVGGSVVYAVTLSVAPSYAGATLSNSATITGSPVDDPDPFDDVSTDADVVVRNADLVAGVTDTPDPAVLGNAVTYTLTATNDGPSDAQNAAVTAILPAELTFVSADPSCAYDPGLAIVLCDAGTLAAGGVATFDIVLEPTVTGVVALDAVVSTSTPDPDASDDTAVAATTVDAAPLLPVDLVAGLADAPDPVNTSGALAYTLSAQNTGPGDAADVDLVQALPAGVTFVSASAGCSHSAGLVTCYVGAINAGATANRAVTVSAPPAVQALSSSVLVTTSSVDSDPTNDAATATTSMVLPVAGPNVADVGVTVTDAPDPVDVGGTVTYAIGVTNAGPDDAENTTVSFSLPAGATFTSATPNVGTCAHAAGVVTCDLGTLASGGATSISVAAVLTTDGTATAIAVVSSDATDGNAANDTASATTTVDPVADLSISKTDGATSVTPGTSPTYTITLSNAGPSAAAAGVVVADPVPAGTTLNGTPPGCSVNAGIVTCTTTAPLSASATVSWQVTLNVPVSYTGVVLDNTASIQSSPTTDPVAANDSATDHGVVAAPPADLSIFKEDMPDPVFAGERITYTITVSNAGPGPAEDVVVTDAVPAATTVADILDGGSESGGVITWTLGTLAAGASATVRLVVGVDANHDGDVTNVASVASSTTDPDPSDDSATAVTTDDPAGVDLALGKTVDETSAKPGDVVTYTIVVSNAGPADATGVVVEDQLPNGLHYVSSKADRGSYEKGSGRWLVGDLPADEDATLEIRARITGAAAESVRNLATVVALDQSDPTPANDRAEAEVEVLGSDVEIVDPVTDDEELAYTGWNFGFAVRLAMILLLLGVALVRLGRRLERRPDVSR
ncbi:MAG TPA: hypothetical protein VEC15_12485 [Actinomycetota bacterium]|nr:hypothetical protein [Actinomycetota bacterium]